MKHQVIKADCLKWMGRGNRVAIADLVIGSPPYALKGNRYEGDGQWKPDAWVKWMAAVTMEARMVAGQWVVWIVNSPFRRGTYHPCVEALVAVMHDFGWPIERPLIWHKNAPPNRKDWFANDWEYILVVPSCHQDKEDRYFDWQSIGTPPKYKSGGAFRQRSMNGQRRAGGGYPQNKVTRPRDVLRATIGGGHMGSKLAHDNEAPFPESLVEPLIKALCPPGGTVLDPFAGSGTVAAVCERLGRNSISIECRQSQVELCRRRIKEAKQKAKGKEPCQQKT